jgi:hypothetical protein
MGHATSIRMKIFVNLRFTFSMPLVEHKRLGGLILCFLAWLLFASQSTIKGKVTLYQAKSTPLYARTKLELKRWCMKVFIDFEMIRKNRCISVAKLVLRRQYLSMYNKIV